MKKFKRLGTLFLCATLILSLAACGKSGSETPNSTASSASDDTYDEHLTLSWLQAGIKSGADYSADDWGRFWLDKFNVDFDIIAVTMDPSDWDERLRIWINSGDMPDVANAQFEFGELENYANQEAIYRLPDDWKERWPNVAKTQENVPAAAMAEEQLGGTYFLYRPVFSLNRPSERLSYHALIYLRKDWMEACGLELKDTYTPDELKEIAKTFLEKDPGNVGDNLVGMSIRPYDMVKLYPTTTFSEACNIGDGYYKDENGQFQWAPADTRTLDALKKYQDLYQEGILDSEFYSYTRYQGAQKFYVQGTSGLTLEDGHAIIDRKSTRLNSSHRT